MHGLQITSTRLTDAEKPPRGSQTIASQRPQKVVAVVLGLQPAPEFSPSARQSSALSSPEKYEHRRRLLIGRTYRNCDRGIVGCIRNEDSLACQPPTAFSLLACIQRYILFHRASLTCIFACGAASFDRPNARVACDSGIVGCIRNEDSLACQPPSAFSLLACIQQSILPGTTLASRQKSSLP